MALFEFAAALDRAEYGGDMPRVVLELDFPGFGICTCDANKNITLLGSAGGKRKTSVWQDFCSVIGVENLDSGAESLNAAMKKYLRAEGQIDCVALDFPDTGRKINATELFKAFGNFRGEIEEVLEKCSELLENLNVDENSVRIVLVGESARFYPAEHIVREYFSFDPFMADSRFAERTFSAVEAELFAAEEAKKAAGRSIGHEIEFIYEYSEDGVVCQKKAQNLAHNEEPVSAFVNRDYSGDILFAYGDEITLCIDGKEKKIKLPQEIFSGGTVLAQLRISVREAKILLCVRDAETKKEIYDVMIEKMGEK